MVWRPGKTSGVVGGLIIVLAVVGVDIFLIQSASGQSLTLNLFFTVLLVILSIPLLILWIYWYYGLLTLRYQLDRNALSIVCGTSRYTVPMEAIEQIVPGKEIRAIQGFRGVGWPGYLMGRIYVEKLGLVVVHATEPLERQLVVVTNSLCYGISPRDATQFLEDFAARRALGPIRPVTQSVEYARLVAFPVWRDGWFWGGLVLAAMACAALFGLVASRYGALPERIPLHFDVQGEVDRIAAKEGLLVIPNIGVITLAVNGLLGLLFHRRERLAAYLLLGMTLMIQAALWLATVRILGG
jgi:hypothetical protein